MKKYYIKDDEDEYEVIEEDVVEEEPVVEDEAEGLSDEEIMALKQLASVADQLIALIQAKEEPVEDEEIGEEEIVDADEDIVEDEDEFVEEKEEEVIDTCKKDSKRSFGALEKRRKLDSDPSLVDEVSEAWAKRYGGK